MKRRVGDLAVSHVVVPSYNGEVLVTGLPPTGVCWSDASPYRRSSLLDRDRPRFGPGAGAAQGRESLESLLRSWSSLRDAYSLHLATMPTDDERAALLREALARCNEDIDHLREELGPSAGCTKGKWSSTTYAGKSGAGDER